MTKNFKTLLKTTAALATLMMGSQSWGATLNNIGTNGDETNGDAVAANGFTIFTTNQATGAITTTGAFTIAAGGKAFFIVGHDGTAVRTLTFGTDDLVPDSNSTVEFYNPVAATQGNLVLTGAIPASATSVTGVNFNIYGGITLPDLSSYPGIKLNILGSGTVAGHANGFAGPIEIFEGQTLTQNTWTKCGGLSGKGTFTAAGVATTVNGDIKGDLTLDLSANSAIGLTVNGNVSTETTPISIPLSVLNTSISGKVTIPVSFTTRSPTSILGGLEGAGSLTVAGSTGYLTVGGDVSKFTGTVTLNANPALFAFAPNVNFSAHQASLTFSNGGTVKKITNSAASILAGGPGGDLTVTTYDMTSANATFNPGSGKKLTIVNLTQSSAATQTITVGAGGTMVFSSNVDMGAVTNSFASPTTIKKLTMVGAGTVNATANVTIDELDVSSAAVTIIPAAGVTVTVKKVTGNNNITVNGAGTLSIKLPSDYTGNVTTTLGKLKTN